MGVNMMYGMFGHGFGYGLFIQLLIFIIFFIIIWWVLQKNSLLRQSSAQDDTPDTILKKRLASGEITLKEYHQLKKEIE